MRVALVAVCLVAAIASQADARPRRHASQSSYSSVPVGGDTSTAQGVAEIQARLGRVGHFGGNSGHEGCGCGATPEAALANCCYASSGMATVDQGTAYGHGRWFACRRYR